MCALLQVYMPTYSTVCGKLNFFWIIQKKNLLKFLLNEKSWNEKPNCPDFFIFFLSKERANYNLVSFRCSFHWRWCTLYTSKTQNTYSIFSNFHWLILLIFADHGKVPRKKIGLLVWFHISCQLTIITSMELASQNSFTSDIKKIDFEHQRRN